MLLDYDAAHRYVETNKNVSWNGWDMEIFKPHPVAAMKKNGAFRNGLWGFLTVVKVNSEGKWNIPNVRNFNRPRTRP